MPITGPEIVRLAEEISQELNIQKLTLIASDLGVPLASTGDLYDRALALIKKLVAHLPPRDGELL